MPFNDKWMEKDCFIYLHHFQMLHFLCYEITNLLLILRLFQKIEFLNDRLFVLEIRA